ncbi:30S ribosome-binding factor RbfA [Candidatus Profftia sp. (ex Adelges kitamiensis)]|uniref:30S ribosome-binding factor RbfA n=1 Tax=Candidatus Profftia sp. (ex Adelges kitamiensis) TaxID=2864218 RepID=UPI001CE358AD|nr:30S ribosome-binding factor RbfA [Candidatus Profftia sp. (ex Adelges kitamiensis)]
MIRKNNRIQRVSQEIQKKIAIILQSHIKDPRIVMVTVSSVKVSCDLNYAKVFVTFLNDHDPNTVKIGLQVLQKVSGFIRMLLSRVMYLRVIPKITFVYDASLIEGIRMSNLITNIFKNDTEHSILSNKVLST